VSASKLTRYAQQFRDLKLTVQDVSLHQISDAKSKDVGDRVNYEVCDYYMPQPIRDAGVYLSYLATSRPAGYLFCEASGRPAGLISCRASAGLM
jgi:hypothetical protein